MRLFNLEVLKNMKLNFSLLFLLMLILLMIFFVSGCGCEKGDNSDSVDDDSSDDDNNDNDNDSTSDDDNDDNDNNDDDNNDDNDDINCDPDCFCPENGGVDVGDIHFEWITGGLPGLDGTSIAIAPDGTRYAAIIKGRILYIYSDDGSDTWTSQPECLVWFAQWPDITVDPDGFLHISYHDSRTYALKYATNISEDWEITTVDDGDDNSYRVGEYSSIALDGNGKVHISYSDFWNRDLKYATNKGGSWATKTVQSLGQVGIYTSIAVEDNGSAHIGYSQVNDLAYELLPYYATNASGFWTYRILGFPGYHGSSLALDSNDKVHIIYSYVDYFYDGSVLHTTNESGQWIVEVVHDLGNYGNFPSLDIDSDDFLHAVYQQYDPGQVFPVYATNLTGSWNVEGIPSCVYADGDNSSLAIDPDEKVHFSHHNFYNMEAKVTTNQSGSWETSVLATGNRFEKCSMAMDSQGYIHVSFYDNLYYCLKYATNSSGQWQITTVDTDGKVGNYNSIAVDGNDHLHISYYDQDNGVLKYATNFSGAWDISIIDSNEGAGRWSSLQMDSSNSAHISYACWGGTNSILKYATNILGVWEDITVDSIGETGFDSSIAIDFSENIHISYVKSYPDSDLMYATNTSGTWVTETVDSNSLVVRTTSIAVDGNDHIHISYFDDIHLNDNLIHTTNKTGDWEFTIVDDVSGIGQYNSNSLGVDSNGDVHICYNNRFFDDLKYANNITGTWISQIIDNAVEAGYSASMKLDENGMVHVIHISDGLWYVAFPQEMEH